MPSFFGLGKKLVEKVFTVARGTTKVKKQQLADTSYTKVVIPDSVVEIGEEAFKDWKSLREIIFDGKSNIQTIGKLCFQNTAVEEVMFPPTVRKIQNGAFEGCSRLKTIHIPDQCKVINASSSLRVLPLMGTCVGRIAVWAMRTVKTVDQPDGIPKIGMWWFSCSDVETVTIPDSVTEICDNAFWKCGSLKYVTFHQNSQLEKIGEDAFSESGLTTFTAPLSLHTVFQSSFTDCHKLKNVELNEGLETLGIGDYSEDGLRYLGVFEGSAIEKITLPSTLKKIEYCVFFQCVNLKSVEFPEGLRVIEQQCFMFSGLSDVKIPDSVIEIKSFAFYFCKNLRTVTFGRGSHLEKIGLGAFAVSGIRNFVAPASLRTIEHIAFYASQLRHIELNENIREIGRYCFSRTSVRELAIPKYIQKTKEELGLGFSCERLIIFSAGDDIADYIQSINRDINVAVIQDDVLKLEEGTFRDCKDLKYVIFQEGAKHTSIENECFQRSGLSEFVAPQSLKVLGQRVFQECSNLQDVHLNDGLESVQSSCFEKSKIAELTVPSSVTEIQNCAFRECEQLRFLIFEDKSVLKQIGTCAFACTNLKSVFAPLSLRTIAWGAFHGCKQLSHVVLNEGLEVLGTSEYFDEAEQLGVFQDSAVETVVLPSTLKSMGSNTFRGCKNLRDPEFPEGLQKLGKGCFQGSGLRKFVAPESFREIGSSAFANCTYLVSAVLNEYLETLGSAAFSDSTVEQVQLSPGLKTIESETFSWCGSLRTVCLPEGLEAIGESSFYGSRVEEIRVPSCVRTIGARAFRGCERLVRLVFADDSTLEEVGQNAFCDTLLQENEVRFPARAAVAESAFHVLE